MRRIIGGVFQSLDGVIQAPGGPTEDYTGGFAHGGWMFPVADETVGEAIGDFFSGPYDLLLGKRTYDIFAAYWPYATGEGAAMGEAFTAANKYVLTRGEQPLPWDNSHRMRGMDDVAALRQGDGPDLLIQGSSTIYPALLAAGLLDQLRLYTFPLVLGHGKRLFGDGTPPVTMKPVDHKMSPGGTVIATYEPAGPVVTESFGVIGQRARAGAAAPDEGGQLVIELFGHPFSSYTWKALIALYENATPFEFRMLDPDHADNAAAFGALSPLGKFPLLLDGETVVAEASVIIEHLQAFPPRPGAVHSRRSSSGAAGANARPHLRQLRDVAHAGHCRKRAARTATARSGWRRGSASAARQELCLARRAAGG